MSTAIPEVPLNNGRNMPFLGLGTWPMDDKQVEEAVKNAIDMGYRHIDTAHIYGNEVGVGKAINQKIKEGVIKREDVFVTSKLWNTFHKRDDVVPACRRTLQALSLDYVDLYLVHWPMGYTSEKNQSDPQKYERVDDTPLEDTWREMESCVDKGLARSIGLSNFNSNQITRILNMAKIKPAVNQVECHVGINQRPLIGFCKEKGVVVTGYCPLARPDKTSTSDNPDFVNNPVVVSVAKRYHKTPAQVLLRYLVEIGVIPLPKAYHKGHMKENMEIFDFKLNDSDLDALHKLNSGFRVVPFSSAKDHPEYPFNIPY